MKIYLAGPDVFLPDAVEIGRRKVELCTRHGLTGLYPLDNAVDLAASDASLQIFRGNETMMIEADAIIANLTPFRGPGADAGTVYELGYMAGRGKLCLGYSNDPSPYADRVRKFTDVSFARWTSGRCAGVDRRGFRLERQSDDDPCARSARLRAGNAAAGAADIWHDLAAFETCVRMAAERLAAPRPRPSG